MANPRTPSPANKYDPSDMLGVIESFPEQCSSAKRVGFSFGISSALKRRYDNVICTGLGGSAIGADIMRSYLSSEAAVPIFVNRDYTLPAFAGRASLVIATSYSGDTEETISAYKDAKKKKAAIVALTSGGQLRDIASKDGFPVILVPKGLPPRGALGYVFFPALILLSRIGIIGDKLKAINDTVKTLTHLKDHLIGHRVASAKNIARAIAKEAHLKYPVIYGAQKHIDAVVTRWRAQIAENSKTLASGHTFPEMTHNEIVCLQNPQRLLKEFIVIVLRDRSEHKRVSVRIDISKKIIRDAGSDVMEVRSVGRGLLERIFSLIYTGDFVSYYLAVMNKVDPMPVERIAYLKKRLAGS